MVETVERPSIANLGEIMNYKIYAEMPVYVEIEADTERDAVELWENMDLTPFYGDALLSSVEPKLERKS